MTDITPQPTPQPNTLELYVQENTNSNSNYFRNFLIGYSFGLAIIIIPMSIYLIYQTEDIIYRGLLLLCLISFILLIYKNKNKYTVIDDNGINLIEG